MKARREEDDNSETGSLFPPENERELTGSSDASIWNDFKEGKEKAFIYIYKTYFSVLYNFGFHITKDPDLIQDCIQDLFIELRVKRKNLSNTDSIRLYLFKSLKRKIIYELDRNERLKIRHQKAHQFDFAFSIEEQIIERQLTEEKVEKLNRLLANLSDRQREAIYYFYYEDMSYSEIAELMNVSRVKSVRNLVYKSLDMLKTGIFLVYFLLST